MTALSYTFAATSSVLYLPIVRLCTAILPNWPAEMGTLRLSIIYAYFTNLAAAAKVLDMVGRNLENQHNHILAP